MPNLNLDQWMQLAMQHHQAGRLDQAQDIYRQILAQSPNEPDALHLLGMIAFQRGDFTLAADLVNRAIAVLPGIAVYHSNLGNVLHAQGKFEAAIATCAIAIELQPALADAHYTLANSRHNLGKLDEAVAGYQDVIRLAPGHVKAHCNLGAALYGQGKSEAAIVHCSRAIELKPDYAEAHNNLASALAEQRNFERAIAALRLAIQIKPDWADPHYNLANALMEQGKFDEAIAAYRETIRLKPDHARVYNNLAAVLIKIENFDAAISICHEAIRRNPSDAAAHANLGIAHGKNGVIEDAMAAFACSIDLKPGNASFHSNLCLALLYDPASNPASILAEHQQWSARHELPLASQILPHDNDPSPDRRLKIGYISPDLVGHPVGRFLLPLLKNHDHDRFEIFCYSDVARPDEVTRQVKGASDHWVEVLGQSHEQVAERIRRDGIDILVDLAAHTGDNRLLVFARKPAPVQATWLGCPTTTGLTSIDYRLTDPYLDPLNECGQFNTEQLIRVPHCTWCFPSPSLSPEVNSLPALSNGYITFACFNNFAKVNTGVLNLWVKLLSAVPDSRLMLQCPAGSSQAAVRQMFESQNISAGRLELVGKVSQWSYYERFYQIDICLDPFPFPGHSTTFDNLWMGVPVITLAGQTSVSRGGVSILSNLGLTEFIAQSPEQYLSIAKAMAENLPHLDEIRSTLRQSLQVSPLMDARAFAGDMETAYRQMWGAWSSAQRKRPG